MEHPITLAHTEHLHVQHRTNVSANEDEMDISLSMAQSEELSVSLGSYDWGSWKFSGDFGASAGDCELVKPTKNNTRERSRATR